MERQFESFVFSVSMIYKDIQKLKSREMAKLGLKGPYALYLYRLQNAPDGLTAVELCRLCGEDKAAVSRALTQLKDAGLVRYREGEAPRRYRSRAVLTPKGKETADRMDERITAYVAAVQAQMDDERRAAFYAALDEIAANLHRLSSAEASGESEV